MAERVLEGKRVLVVEDEMIIAFDIMDSIESAGAHVVGPYAALEDALAAAERESFDLAVLDIDLADKEVFPLARLLQQREIPFVFYTGQPDRDALRDDFSGVPVCTKPESMSRVISTLSSIGLAA